MKKLNKVFVMGVIGGGAILTRKIMLKKKSSKSTYPILKDLLPYIDSNAEIKFFDEREPIFYVFIKDDLSFECRAAMQSNLVFIDNLSAKYLVKRADSWVDDVKISNALNSKVISIATQKDNENLLEFQILKDFGVFN